MKRTLLLLLGLTLAAGALSAARAQQAPGRQGPPGGPPPGGNGEVRGSVVEEGGGPIAGATVAVWSKRDSSLVAGAVVRDDGAFRVQGLRPGEYRLRVTSLGYVPKNHDVSLSESAPVANVGAIGLAPDAIEQEEIAVSVERPTVSLEPDRNAYRAKDIAPAAANASDVLEATPSVTVDTDGKVSLRGNENVAVQINGRPAPITGSQLGNYLRQLPAAMVERVEVIPTPSARYDPEGMAGIINIVMKQNTDLGWSGGFTVAAATAERYNAGANFGYQRGPLSLLANYGFNYDKRDFLGINDRLRFAALDVPESFTEQDISGDNHNLGHNLSTSADLRLGERDVLSGSLVMNRRGFEDSSLAAYRELDADRDELDRYDRLRDADVDNFLIDTSLAFKRTFQPRQHELSTELRFNRTKDDDHALLSLFPTPGGSETTELEDNTTDALARQVTAQLDYTRTFGGGTKLETGYKGTARWLDQDYVSLLDSLGTGTWTPSDLSNSFTFDEQVHAVYGVLTRGVGKFELQGGLRAELASQDFALADPAESFPHDYSSLFPSGVVSYNVSEQTQAKISYSRRIRRPGTQELNPFPRFMDPQTAFLGNPELDPEYTDALELGLTHQAEWGSLQISPFYRHTSDVIRFIVNTTDVINGREVTSVSFDNLDTSDSWGADLNTTFQLGRFNGFGALNVFKMVTDGGSESSLSSDAVTWTARLNASTQLTPDLTLQAQYFYRAPMNFERGRFSAFQNGSFALRQKVMGERGTVTLRLTDPFETAGFRVEAGDDEVLQITERSFNARALHITFQYTFGQAPRVRQPRPDAQPEPQAGFPQ